MSGKATGDADINLRCLFLMKAMKHYISLCCCSSLLVPDLFFFLLVPSTPESDAPETALMEQFGLKCAANLQALPELFNCGIYRSDGESFISSVCLLPLSACLCAFFFASPMFIFRLVNRPGSS